jgi:hypothetical protein
MHNIAAALYPNHGLGSISAANFEGDSLSSVGRVSLVNEQAVIATRRVGGGYQLAVYPRRDGSAVCSGYAV